MAAKIALCGVEGCRRPAGHPGRHQPYPCDAWSFLAAKDKYKLVKAGFATPRGGAKGAYQNHVIRSSKVIIPYEKRADMNLALYKDGYVFRLFPDQYFDAPRTPKREFTARGPEAVVGENAFVLYRTHASFERFPPMKGWGIRTLFRNGVEVDTRRGVVDDVGHYVLRIATLGGKLKQSEGPPQGIFATEYADENTNYLCKCVLAWLILQAAESPFKMPDAGHLAAILAAEGLDDFEAWDRRGILRRGRACCPLCLRIIQYRELHETVSFEEANALANAGLQVEGATRSTVVNLFHLEPLVYHALTHVPGNVGWGHAVCNTLLGQRHCYSVYDLQQQDVPVSIARDADAAQIGWISEDQQMIRSPAGAVWIRLSDDMSKEEQEGAPGRPAIAAEEE